jgi:phosphoribosylformimino-5-aminoimidazole carboxamide ribotide isomerase
MCMIIYPAIDLRHGRCVRLVQGDPRAETVFGDDPAAIARRWIEMGAQWLHVVNLDGAFALVPCRRKGGDQSATGRNAAALCAILEAVTVPVQFGGGLRGLGDIEAALSLGVSRVVIGTAALQNPEMVEQAVRRFGGARVAVALDVRDGRVATHGWQMLSEETPLSLALRMKEAGVGRIVHTDISRDGMLSGVNAEACAGLARESGLPVIASGGVAGLEDVRRVKAMENVGVEGIIIGKALYVGQINLRAALALADEG